MQTKETRWACLWLSSSFVLPSSLFTPAISHLKIVTYRTAPQNCHTHSGTKAPVVYFMVENTGLPSTSSSPWAQELREQEVHCKLKCNVSLSCHIHWAGGSLLDKNMASFLQGTLIRICSPKYIFHNLVANVLQREPLWVINGSIFRRRGMRKLSVSPCPAAMCGH